ncbi:VIT family-domain-containing protein [Xylariales sp. AK1849]|nr:VIT family-domain-containing protein [Xylariales sp. AK1849]
MATKNLLRKVSLQEPEYTTIPTTPSSSTSASQTNPSLADCDNSEKSARSHSRSIHLPSLSRFLADFTLGFADGLTVPFALTAGLSSLGQTNTVILAGMAEISAGSISMGIGGYLSARGDIAAAAATKKRVPQVCDNFDQEKTALRSSHAIVEDYLAPLRLPQHLMEAVRAHVHTNPSAANAVCAHLESTRDKHEEDSSGETCSPIMNGFSVALGYLLGGLLPLFPYFFVAEVAAGLQWSFAVCIVALFIFGFTKHYLLQEEVEDKTWSHAWHYHARRWSRIKQSAWEGLQMVILGSIAAMVALLCVKASEGIVS